MESSVSLVSVDLRPGERVHLGDDISLQVVSVDANGSVEFQVHRPAGLQVATCASEPREGAEVALPGPATLI